MSLMPRKQSTNHPDATLWDHSDGSSVVTGAEHAADLLHRANSLVAKILSNRRLGWLMSDRDDYRQDVLLALFSKFKKVHEPGVEPIKDYEAYIAQTSLNHYRRSRRQRIADPIAESIDSDELNAALVEATPSQEEALVADEAVKIAWRECMASMNAEQLALFLFDRNDILWQLVSIGDPISIDEIGEALKRTPSDLARIMKQLPCKNDRELAQLMGIKEERIYKLRNRMKPLFKRIKNKMLLA